MLEMLRQEEQQNSIAKQMQWKNKNNMSKNIVSITTKQNIKRNSARISQYNKVFCQFLAGF